MSFSKSKLTRRGFLSAAAVTGAGAVLAGCAPQPAPAPAPTTAPEATKAPAVAPTKAPEATKAATAAPQAGKCQMDWAPQFPPFKKYSPDVVLKVEDAGQWSCIETDKYNDNPMYNLRRDLMGIRFEPHWSAEGDARTAKRAADIASGTMADYFVCTTVEAAQFIANGAAEEIRAVVDAVFSPLSKKVMHYPDGESWVPATRGDKLYGFPEEGGGGSLDSLCWIRQDWLEKVGLPLPTTVADLDKTMRAFKEKGLSKYGIGAGKNLITWGATMDAIFGAHGVMPTVWRDYGDGKLTYGSIRPENKEVLALLRQWYKDGLMHPDFYTFGQGDSFAQFTSQQVGIYYGAYWLLGRMQAVEKEVPGAKWAYFTGIKGPQGKVGRRGGNASGRVYCFRKGIERQKIEAVLNYLNWNNELFFNFPKWQVYQWEANIGIWKEGYDWVWGENCELQAGKCFTRNTGAGHWIAACLSNEGTAAYWNNVEPWINEKDRSKLNKAQRLIADPAKKPAMEVYRQAYNTQGENMLNQFLGAPGPKMVAATGQLRALEDAAYLEIIRGSRPLEAFDQFVAEWKKSGGDDVTAEVNAWYATVKK